MEEKKERNRKKEKESELEKTYREEATKGLKSDCQDHNDDKWRMAGECTCDPTSCRC